MVETITPEVTTAATTLAGEKAADVVADAAKEEAKSTAEETTLLGKEKEEAAVAPIPKVIPEKYEFKAPEGTTLDQASIDKFTPVFKELNLTQVEAQKLVDASAPYIQQQVEAHGKGMVENYQKMVGEWKDQTIKELGADHAKELASASKFIEKFGSPELRTLLNETGLGNHIEVVRAFIKAGKTISQDSLADSPTKKGTTVVTNEDRAAVLFPSHKP